MPTNPSPLEWILEEQRAARDYILSGGADQRGAWQWLADNVAEEVLLSDELTPEEARTMADGFVKALEEML